MRSTLVAALLLSATALSASALRAAVDDDVAISSLPAGSAIHARVLKHRRTGKLSAQRVVVPSSKNKNAEQSRKSVKEDAPSRPDISFPAIDDALYSPVVTCSIVASFSETGWYLFDASPPSLRACTGDYAVDQSEDILVATAAGYCEGAITRDLIITHYNNRYVNSPIPANVTSFFYANQQWIKQQISQNAGNYSDPFWPAAAVIQAQFDGLVAGSGLPMPFVMALTAMGDMFDLIPALGRQEEQRRQREDRARGLDARPISDLPDNWPSMSKADFDLWFASRTHCSALVKVTPDKQDIFFGHASWFDYTDTLRIYRRVALNLCTLEIRSLSFSSYPGMVASFDDFYVSSRNIVSIETSLSVFNNSVYDGNVVPQSAPYWLRVMVANYMAVSAPSWASIFKMYNSGTYNNQWLIVDLNLFTPGAAALPNNTMWIAEQMPGLVLSYDVTATLNSQGYFPGYNVPMSIPIFNALGYPAAVAQQGPQMTSYNNCVRAQIFRRDQGNITSLSKFQAMMQYNDFQNDPISAGNPLYAIASRVDLPNAVAAPQCFGAYDAKTSSYTQWFVNSGSVLVFAGPTPQQATFSFNTTKAVCDPHSGLPETFAFGFVNMSFANPSPVPQQALV